MKKKRFERAVDGFFTVAAIVLILVLVYTVALRVASDEGRCAPFPAEAENCASTSSVFLIHPGPAGAGLPDGESEGGTAMVKGIHPPRPEAWSLVAAGGETPPLQEDGSVEENIVTEPSGSGSGTKEERPESGQSFRLPTQEEAEQSEPGSDDAVIVREDIPMDKLHQAALVEICREAGVDINLAYGLIMTESSFNPWAVSETGCYGYCQLSCYFPSGMSPEDNLRAGIGWLGELIAEHGDVGKALTVYHLGRDDGTRDYAGVVLGYARSWGYEQ